MAEFHGIITKREDVGVRPVGVVPQSTIGVVGTAPAAKVDGAFGDGTAIKYNESFDLTSRQDASDADLGTDGTLPAVLNAIYRQGQASVQMVIVEEGANKAAAAEQSLAVTHFVTVTSQTALNNLAGAEVRWALIRDSGQRYLAFKNLTNADETKLSALTVGRQITIEPHGGGSVLKTYTVEGAWDSTNKRILVNLDAETHTLTHETEYDVTAIAQAAIDGDDVTRDNMTGAEANSTGVYALLSADPIPKLLCVGTELANIRVGGNANALASALVEVATKLRGTAILDGPGASNAEAKAFADDFDSPNAYLVEPGVVTADGEVLPSPSVAGLIAVNDLQNGFWTSPSNEAIQGILGITRQLSHGFVGSQSDDLNKNQVAAIVRDAGYRLWGNETLAQTDPSYRFLSVARTANAIEDSLIAAHKWAIAENITAQYFDIVAQSVNSFLAKLQGQGAITGGECYPADKTKNNAAAFKEGQVFFNVEWSAAYPAQTINITIQLSDRFLEALAEAV